MAIKKSELYSSLWASCDELRGGMDASQYKDYVLALLFIKFVSDKYVGVPYAPVTVPEGASFAHMAALKGKPDIGDQINKQIFGHLTEANHQLARSDFPNFNDPVKLGDGKEMVDRLTNLILHNCPTSAVMQGNTLANPLFKEGDKLKTFDYVVANPPFSDKRWSNGLDPLNDPYDRFAAFGVPPAKQGDYAYLLHIVRSLKSTGAGACILPHGVLFRGNAEAEIRKTLIRKGYIRGIIGLPANLFYGTGIPACIIVLDKRDAQARKGIFMIDASAGFSKDGPKNRLRSQDIHRIVDTFRRRVDVPKFARMVPVEEIERNDFNLNLPRYIDSSEPEDRQDISSVYPPTGRVRISAPLHMNMKSIRSFAISKLDWIRRQQTHIAAQERESPREYLERETHYVWGQRFLMQVIEGNRSGVELKHHTMLLLIRPGTSLGTRHEIVQNWYRIQLKEAIPPLLAKWEPIVGKTAKSVTIRHMKTMWGSCTPERGTIRINLELAKKPPECLWSRWGQTAKVENSFFIWWRKLDQNR